MEPAPRNGARWGGAERGGPAELEPLGISNQKVEACVLSGVRVRGEGVGVELCVCSSALPQAPWLGGPAGVRAGAPLGAPCSYAP